MREGVGGPKMVSTGKGTGMGDRTGQTALGGGGGLRLALTLQRCRAVRGRGSAGDNDADATIRIFILSNYSGLCRTGLISRAQRPLPSSCPRGRVRGGSIRSFTRGARREEAICQSPPGVLPLILRGYAVGYSGVMALTAPRGGSMGWR